MEPAIQFIPDRKMDLQSIPTPNTHLDNWQQTARRCTMFLVNSFTNNTGQNSSVAPLTKTDTINQNSTLKAPMSTEPSKAFNPKWWAYCKNLIPCTFSRIWRNIVSLNGFQKTVLTSSMSHKVMIWLSKGNVFTDAKSYHPIAIHV